MSKAGRDPTQGMGSQLDLAWPGSLTESARTADEASVVIGDGVAAAIREFDAAPHPVAVDRPASGVKPPAIHPDVPAGQLEAAPRVRVVVTDLLQQAGRGSRIGLGLVPGGDQGENRRSNQRCKSWHLSLLNRAFGKSRQDRPACAQLRARSGKVEPGFPPGSRDQQRNLERPRRRDAPMTLKPL
jgi:hypothetical protein